MEGKFVPELHDIGKMIDRDKIVAELKSRGFKKISFVHTFEKFPFDELGLKKPVSMNWWGQYHHFRIGKKLIYEIDVNKWSFINVKDVDIKRSIIKKLFLLILSDHLSASISRALKRRTSIREKLTKLWNRNFNPTDKWIAFRNLNELSELFKEIDECNSGKEFLEKYFEKLHLTPEAKHIPLTTLYTHCMLTGKIFRVLEKVVEIGEDEDGFYLEYNGKRVKSVREAEGGNRTEKTDDPNDYRKGKWQFKLIKAKIRIPHYFTRLQHINVIKKRRELLEDLCMKYSDNILISTYDSVLIFAPINFELEDVFKNFLEWGFLIESIEIIADAGILSSNLDRKILEARRIVCSKGKKAAEKERNMLEILKERAKVKHVFLQKKMPDEIKPQICDICQISRGKERWKENVREWICESCLKIENMGIPFREYSEWDNLELRTIWFKIGINLEKLEKWLQRKFNEYVEEKIKNKYKEELKREFRSLALMSDFIEEYNRLLEEVYQKLCDEEILTIKRLPIEGYKELFVTLADDLNKIMKIINLFEKIYGKYFPNVEKDERSPINLSLTITTTKYPLREIWRFFKESEEKGGFINIFIQNIGGGSFTSKEIKEIIGLEITSAWFNLYKIYKEKRSEILYQVGVYNQYGKKAYDILKHHPEKIYILRRLLKSES
ncbi:MAG: hypothetical protein DRJ30_06560 [Candidatus Methanomethylicota archaeon]|nr:MAG: hypothetical protein DRJ30_06560 [Candidatus Verstraetearchaeota archaeon]